MWQAMELLSIHRRGYEWEFGPCAPVLVTHKKHYLLQWEYSWPLCTVLSRSLCPCFGSLCGLKSWSQLFLWLCSLFLLTWIKLSLFGPARNMSLDLQTTRVSWRSLLECLINNREGREKDKKKSFGKSIIWSLTTKPSLHCEVNP